MTYTRMDEMTAEDLSFDMQRPRLAVSKFVLEQLELLKQEQPTAAGVDRYTHSLQTASRALHDGADEETVVCALLHDVGDTLAPNNHAEMAAAILRPFVSERNYWVIKYHDLFQGYYFYHMLGKDRMLRDAYRDSPHFKACVRFCERWDQRSFDPAYPTESLNRFLPMVRDLFDRTPKDLAMLRD
ncbi:HD domain-containing protein [Nocardia sp. NPDC059246]|uniref:HD domain-containing protein n=1 Tax=unclassified Nocardia TaxID=2637762 RepID=UPI003694B284